ncbi:hypothetical protein ACOJQI_10645 [Bacillus salacetis]
MNNHLTKLTYDEIDQLLEPTDKNIFKDINWKFISEEEMESLLRTP